MARIRSKVLPILASSLSMAVLAGCPNAGTQPALPGTPTMAPSGAGQVGAANATPSAPSSTATPGASDTGNTATSAPVSSPSTSTAATPTPQVSAPSASGATTILQGDVYDESGAAVDGATVTVNSLDATHAYTATLTTVQGHYVTNNVPVGVQIRVSATKQGWTNRSRVQSFQENNNSKNTMNFGGTSTDDSAGAAYFISNYPEISGTIPDTDTIDGKHLGYKIRLSEPLDADNQRRLQNAVLISADPPPGKVNPIIIKNTATFLQANRKLSMSWNSDGTELTLSFDAPLRRLKNDKKTYALSISRPSGDDPIQDSQNNVLGYTTPSAGSTYDGAIKLASLALASTDTTAALRWAATHTRASGFDLNKDDQNPTVMSVTGSPVTTNNGDRERIEITFSKPALVFPDVVQTVGTQTTLAGSDASVTDLSNYAFAISDTTVTGIDMKKVITTPNTISTNNNNANLSTLTTYMNGSTPFRVDSTVAQVQVSTTNPDVVQIDILKSMWPTTAKNVRVRVEPTWLDPSGNHMSETNEQADLSADNVKDGPLQ